ERGRMRVTRGPKENRFRPAVDPLFRSAANAYGERVVGVILTGALDDGTAGLWTIKSRGGLAVVQDPEAAEHPSMPASALRAVDVDDVVPVAEMAELFGELSEERVSVKDRNVSDPESTDLEVRIAAEETLPAPDIF